MTPDELKLWYDQLKGDNSTMESQLQDIANYVYPRRSDFITRRTQGESLVEYLYDTTAVHANEMLSSGLHGLMTSASSRWFGLKVEAGLMREKAVQVWLDEVNDRMFAAINMPKAGFAPAMHEFYMEYCGFGTGSLFVTENKDRDGLFFEARPITECQFAEGEDGVIDTFLRRFEYTADKCYRIWGSKVSPKVKKKIQEGNLEEKIEIQHSIVPENGRFTSVYFETEPVHILHDGFFQEQPQFAPRFYKTTFEVMGRSPSFTMLPDIKMLNKMAQTTIRAAEKVVDPPLQMPNDGFTSPARVMAGGVNYYEAGSRDRIEPLRTGGNIQLGEVLMNEIRQRIRAAFFNDQLELYNDRPQMTATEVMQRTEERLRLLSPVTGRIQTELFSPMIDRVFGLMSRMGAFPPAPDVIRGKNLTVEYTSPIARATAQVEAQGLVRTFEVMQPMIDRNPQLMDKIDGDYAFEHVGIDMYSVDPKVFNPQDKVDTIRQTRNKAQKQNHDMELAKGAAVARQ